MTFFAQAGSSIVNQWFDNFWLIVIVKAVAVLRFFLVVPLVVGYIELDEVDLDPGVGRHRLHVSVDHIFCEAFEAVGGIGGMSVAIAGSVVPNTIFNYNGTFTITNVTATSDVQAVLLGDEGVIHTAAPGTICIDHSTIAVQ